jgi:hypothetical protein
MRRKNRRRKYEEEEEPKSKAMNADWKKEKFREMKKQTETQPIEM